MVSQAEKPLTLQDLQANENERPGPHRDRCPLPGMNWVPASPPARIGEVRTGARGLGGFALHRAHGRSAGTVCLHLGQVTVFRRTPLDFGEVATISTWRVSGRTVVAPG